jgi:hypothetical protein
MVPASSLVTLNPSPLGLNSLFGILLLYINGQPVVPWLKLESSHHLSLFHAQYWGQDISQERGIWLQTPEAHQMDTDEEQMDTDEYQMDTDGNQMDNDKNQMKTGVTPAGFPLHFDILALKPLTLWVCKDYKSLYDWCMYYFN